MPCYRVTSKGLEQDYNELLDKMINIKNECERSVATERIKHEANVKNIKLRKKKNITMISIAMLICVIALTFVIGTYVFPSLGSYQYEELANGKDIVCYVTNTGDCYHKINCRYLKSVNETTMYWAEMDGYRPCEICWKYPKAVYCTVTETDYLQKYGSIFAILTCLSLILFYKIYKKEDKKFKVELERENKDFEYFKKFLHLKKVINELGFENEFEITAKYYSEVPFGVSYDDDLPITKDDRFIVYRSIYGKRYHSQPVCRGDNLLYKLHIFSAMENFEPCYFCATKIEIPTWHKKYIEMHNLYKEIVNICKYN